MVRVPLCDVWGKGDSQDAIARRRLRRPLSRAACFVHGVFLLLLLLFDDRGAVSTLFESVWSFCCVDSSHRRPFPELTR